MNNPIINKRCYVLFIVVLQYCISISFMMDDCVLLCTLPYTVAGLLRIRYVYLAFSLFYIYLLS